MAKEKESLAWKLVLQESERLKGGLPRPSARSFSAC